MIAVPFLISKAKWTDKAALVSRYRLCDTLIKVRKYMFAFIAEGSALHAICASVPSYILMQEHTHNHIHPYSHAYSF